MKYLLSIALFLCFLHLVNSQSEGDDYYKNSQTEEQKTDSTKVIWTDNRIETYQGRIEIIEEAWQSVVPMLIKCGDSLLGLLLAPNNTSPKSDEEESSVKGIYIAPSKNFEELFRFKTLIIQPFYFNDGLTAFSSITVVNVKYTQILKDKDFARGKSKLKYSAIERVKNKWGRDFVYDPYEVEKFTCDIEVFPTVFENEEYWMESEGRWAESPLEALEFILLHELGHFEIYSTKNTRIEILKNFTSSILTDERVDEEEICDEFASSIFSCFKNRSN